MDEQPIVNNQIQQSPASINPIRKKSNHLMPAIAALILVLFIGVIYIFTNPSQKQIPIPLPDPPLPPTISSKPSSAESSTANWKTYTSTRLSIKYPLDLGIITESISKVEFGNPNFRNIFISIYFSKITDIPEKTESIMISGKQAKKFLFQDPVGDGTSYLVTQTIEEPFVEIRYKTGFGVSKEDSALVFDQILSSMKFIDGEEQVVCTQDAKLCPDGVTYVGRQGPNCEFAPCPQN